VNELERHTLILIGENADSPDVFTDDEVGLAPIRDSINDAVQEVVMLTGSRKTTVNLALRQGRNFYRLALASGHVGWITDAWLNGQDRRLEQTDFAKLDRWDPRWMVSTGTPDFYFQVGLDVIGVAPRPSATADVLSLSVVWIPAPYTHDKDRVTVRNDFRLAVAHYAVSEYWAGRGDAKAAGDAFARYRDALGMRDDQPRHGDWRPALESSKEPWPTGRERAPV